MPSRILTPTVSFTRFLATPPSSNWVNNAVEKPIQMEDCDILSFTVTDDEIIMEIEEAGPRGKSRGPTVVKRIPTAPNGQIPEIVGIRRKIDFEDI